MGPRMREDTDWGAWVRAFARKREGGAGTAGGWGFFMGGMVAREGDFSPQSEESWHNGWGSGATV